MKLSDAIVLGSTQVILESRVWFRRLDRCGCLIGMGAFALDAERIMESSAFVMAVEEWPWLYREFAAPIQLMGWSTQVYASAYDIISNLAGHVHSGRISLEQAVEWIRQNEPQEEVNGGNESEGCDRTGNESSTTVECGDEASVGITCGK